MKKQKSLKRLSDKELAKLVGGAQVSAAGGATWLYDCWEGVCTAIIKDTVLRDPKNAKYADPLKKEVLKRDGLKLKGKKANQANQ